MVPMTMIKATAVGRTCCGASPRVVTAAGMAKTPPPTMAFTKETIISTTEDFFDPVSSDDGAAVVELVKGKGNKVDGVRCCGSRCWFLGRVDEVEVGIVFRSESHILVRLVLDATNQGALRSVCASVSSTHWALYRVFLLFPVFVLLLLLEDDILGIARIEFVAVIVDGMDDNDGDETLTPSNA